MSLNIAPIQPVSVMDPRLNVEPGDRRYAVFRGGSQVSWKPVISQNFSTSSIQFTAPPPAPGIVVDRRVLLQIPVTISFTGVNFLGSTSLLGGNGLVYPAYNATIGPNDALRADPISQMIQNIAVTINNTQVSLNMNDVITGLRTYDDFRGDRDIYESMSPAYPDQFQAYGDYVTLGSNRNPLANYGENASEVNRGAFPMRIISNGLGVAQVQAVLTEQIYLSPFLFGHKQHSGFVNVQNMDFNINLASNLGAKIWSHASVAGGNSLSSATVTFNGAPTLLFNYITPPLLMQHSLSTPLELPYFDVQRYPTDLNASLASGASVTMQSNNIQLQSIPYAVYIYARMRNADQTFNTSDSFAVINQVSVNWNNNSGLLSSATQNDLYKISMENGCNLSWPQWSQFRGSVLKLEFGKQIGLQDNEGPGKLGTYQFQYQANITNTSNAAINYTLYTVVLSEGVISIFDNRSVTQIGVLSEADILSSYNMPHDYNALKSLYGGDFLSTARSFLGNIGQAALKYGPAALQVAKAVAPFVGLGMSGGARRRVKRCPKGSRRKRGGVLIGGAMLDRDALRENVEEYDDHSE